MLLPDSSCWCTKCPVPFTHVKLLTGSSLVSISLQACLVLGSICGLLHDRGGHLTAMRWPGRLGRTSRAMWNTPCPWPRLSSWQASSHTTLSWMYRVSCCCVPACCLTLYTQYTWCRLSLCTGLLPDPSNLHRSRGLALHACSCRWQIIDNRKIAGPLNANVRLHWLPIAGKQYHTTDASRLSSCCNNFPCHELSCLCISGWHHMLHESKSGLSLVWWRHAIQLAISCVKWRGAKMLPFDDLHQIRHMPCSWVALQACCWWTLK